MMKIRKIKNIMLLLLIVFVILFFFNITNSTNSKIIVLNKQEYPKLHSNWTVKFITAGKSDLIIEGIKGDYAKINDNSYGDLELLQLKCGENVLFDKNNNAYDTNMGFIENKVIYYNYSCAEISTWTVKLLECAEHRQHFIFGDSEDFANNACSGDDDFTIYIKDPNNDVAASSSEDINPTTGVEYDDCSDSFTNQYPASITCQREGIYTYNLTSVHNNIADTTLMTCYAPSENKFVIKDSSGANVAAIDEKGYLYLKGQNYTSQGSLSPPAESFVIKTSDGTNIAYIDISGNLYLKGIVLENQTSLNPPSSSFIVKNSSEDYIAYIDISGNLTMSGWLYEEWLDPI